ncbi:MAG: MFS transporter [Acidobacteria bacterium]|nr:MFS transporter [Acidobacteriota bacterium]
MSPNPISHLRWWIGGLLFASTVINYIDRQTLNVLAPFLKEQYHWTNTDFATLVIAFRIAYAVMQTVSGRLLDWLGTRRGMLLTVSWYSAAAMLTSLANGLWGFRFFRFLLGCWEAANWPGAAKAVGEWFPDRERGWAVAMFDSGSAIGAAVAPALVVWLHHHFGSWRPVFLLTGLLGWIWLLAWHRLYQSPAQHPRLSAEERRLIEQGQSRPQNGRRPTWHDWTRLLTVPQTWGIVMVRALLDPYWFLMSDWFAIYLVNKGFRLEDTLTGFWLPFLAADLGNFFGGGLSSWFIRRGRPVMQARKLTFLLCAPGMLAMGVVTMLDNFAALIACFGLAMFCYAACATIYLVLPSDLFPNRAVASVSGLSGTGAGIGTIVSTYTIGRVTDLTNSFTLVFLGASLAPVLSVILLLALVRRPVAVRE